MLRALKQFLFADYGPAPRPDETIVPKFDAGTVIESIYSEGRENRVFITKDEQGLYRLNLEWWDATDWAAGYGARWAGGYAGSLTDSLQRAQELAREELGRL